MSKNYSFRKQNLTKPDKPGNENLEMIISWAGTCF